MLYRYVSDKFAKRFKFIAFVVTSKNDIIYLYDISLEKVEYNTEKSKFYFISLFLTLLSLSLKPIFLVATVGLIFLSIDQYAKHFPPAQNNDERKGLEPGSGKAQNR